MGCACGREGESSGFGDARDNVADIEREDCAVDVDCVLVEEGWEVEGFEKGLGELGDGREGVFVWAVPSHESHIRLSKPGPETHLVYRLAFAIGMKGDTISIIREEANEGVAHREMTRSPSRTIPASCPQSRPLSPIPLRQHPPFCTFSGYVRTAHVR